MKIANITARFALLSALTLLVGLGNANASNIAVLDVENIIKNSSVMKDIQKRVSGKQSEFQKEIDKRQADLEAESKKIQSKKGVLSDEAFVKEQEKFEKKVEELKAYVEKKQNSLRKASLDAMSQVNEKMKDIIEEVSTAKGFDVVIPSAGTLYFKDSSMDISSEVLKKLNKSIAKVEVKFE
jgi:outer membrane protein